MEKNTAYWNEGMPYLDGIEFYHALPFSTELGSAILSRRVDYARILDPVTTRKAAATPGMSTATFNQSVIHGTWVNTRHAPLDDPRVRRAMHLALDRPVLIDVVKDVTPMQVGGFIYPFSDFATPKAELFQRIGYQDDNTGGSRGGTQADGGGRPRGWHQRFGLPGPRCRQLQAVGTGNPGDAERVDQRRLQSAHGGRVGLVR